MKASLLSILLLFSALAGAQIPTAHDQGRAMVITLDDLPVISMLHDITSKRTITRKLLATLTRYKVPAIGFVNEKKLYQAGEIDPQRVALLQQWVDAGLELGNHTFSHPSYHKVSFSVFTEDIKKGEMITQSLLAQQNRKIRYFRHPFLHTGNTPEKKAQLNSFLAENNYRIAPVTVDNSDWIFARAYDKAILAKDSVLMQKIGEAFVAYMQEKIIYFEQQSAALFGREIKQVLLLHANTINADYLDELMEMMHQRGYRFISLEKALTDEAYHSKDHYTGNAGISWIHRWAITQGKKGDFFKEEPVTPSFVMEVAGITAE